MCARVCILISPPSYPSPFSPCIACAHSTTTALQPSPSPIQRRRNVCRRPRLQCVPPPLQTLLNRTTHTHTQTHAHARTHVHTHVHTHTHTLSLSPFSFSLPFRACLHVSPTVQETKKKKKWGKAPANCSEKKNHQRTRAKQKEIYGAHQRAGSHKRETNMYDTMQMKSGALWLCIVGACRI